MSISDSLRPAQKCQDLTLSDQLIHVNIRLPQITTCMSTSESFRLTLICQHVTPSTYRSTSDFFRYAHTCTCQHLTPRPAHTCQHRTPSDQHIHVNIGLPQSSTYMSRSDSLRPAHTCQHQTPSDQHIHVNIGLPQTSTYMSTSDSLIPAHTRQHLTPLDRPIQVNT